MTIFLLLHGWTPPRIYQMDPNGFCQHHFLTGLLGSLEVHVFGDKYSVLPDCPAEGWKSGWGGVGMLPLWNLHTCSSRSGGSVRVGRGIEAFGKKARSKLIAAGSTKRTGSTAKTDQELVATTKNCC